MYEIRNLCIVTNWAVHIMKASNAVIVLSLCHRNGLQVCFYVGLWALEVYITQIIVFYFDASCWIVSFLLCFEESCFLKLLGDSLRFREILKWLGGGNGAVMLEGIWGLCQPSEMSVLWRMILLVFSDCVVLHTRRQRYHIPYLYLLLILFCMVMIMIFLV